MNHQLLLDVLPAPAPTFANYIAGPNAHALAAAQALAPGQALYLWGASGCGRSHLLRALTLPSPQKAVEGQPSANLNPASTTCLYLGAENAHAALIAFVQASRDTPLPALIAIDDLDHMTPAGQAALFTLYNHWREVAATRHAFALAVAGGRAPLTMSLREDLRTRLGWGLVFRLYPLSDADKRTALQHQALARGLHLTPEILNWMLTHYKRDMRHLTALLDALDRYSLATRRSLTLPLLRTMLTELNIPTS